MEVVLAVNDMWTLVQLCFLLALMCQVDVYSFALILYFMASGRTPFYEFGDPVKVLDLYSQGAGKSQVLRMQRVTSSR
eukprot:5781893-Amphidinium_carterae.1